MYTLNGSVVRLVGELSYLHCLHGCIAAYSILYSKFGLVSCIDLFLDVSDGQLRCKINRKVHVGKDQEKAQSEKD